MPDGQKRDLVAELVVLRPELVRQALALTSNRADAEDLVQAAFERVLRRRDTLFPDTRLRAWAATVMRNLMIDQARHACRTRQEGNGGDLSNLPSPEIEPRPWWESIGERQVRQALAGCPPRLRETFELRHDAGLSLEEIARRTRAPIGTVATRLFRTRAHLRRVLTAQHAAKAGGPAIGAASVAAPPVTKPGQGRALVLAPAAWGGPEPLWRAATGGAPSSGQSRSRPRAASAGRAKHLTGGARPAGPDPRAVSGAAAGSAAARPG
jgi:RNA polymerase sigma-70 factor, ECF subfamily